MQWTPAAPSRTSTSDLVLSRVLEHYNVRLPSHPPVSPSRLGLLADVQITHPLRSSIQFRTFRATFPTPTTDAVPSTSALSMPSGKTAPTRILTTVTYSQQIPPVRDVSVLSGARDDCTYLFLEDRGVPNLLAPKRTSVAEEKAEVKGQEGEKTDKKTEVSKDEKKDDKKEDGHKDEKKEGEPIEIKDDLEEDGFEIIDAPKDDPAAPVAPVAPAQPAPAPSAGEPAPAPAPTPTPAEPIAPAPRQRQKFKTLAVKPATLVMPTLHNLLSPFVLGLSKQARAGASTTGQAAAPTPLSGTSMVITTLAFPAPAHPQPHIKLSAHILPNSAATIFLEAEWDGPGPGAASQEVIQEFLQGCIPDGVVGDARFLAWEGEENGLDDWSGIERIRRVTSLLCRALRESNII